jgi:DNA-binding CsgD family transcriptional regulator
VSLGLSAIELARLQAALATLLSPLDFERVGAWRHEVRHTVQALLGADSSVSLLQIPGEAPFEADDLQPLADYGAYYHRFDRVDKYRDLGTVAFTWDLIGHLWERPSRERWLASEFYNDWVVRNRLCQPRGLNVALPGGQPLIGPPQGQDVAALYFYQNRERPAIDRERQLLLLQTLLPAFTAGAYIALHMGARATLEQLAGTLEEGVALLDQGGRVAYQNAAMSELIREDPESARLERECAHLSRALLLLAATPGAKSRVREVVNPGPRALRTHAAAYRLHGALIGRGLLGAGPMALVLLERTTLGRRSLEAVAAYCGLTPRERTVARVLADGRSNEELARLLGVSIHTARRHVEHVLLKLGVHSRAAVAARLWEGSARRGA